jgi:hypothetical protein
VAVSNAVLALLLIAVLVVVCWLKTLLDRMTVRPDGFCVDPDLPLHRISL